jgi:hypothetical protein
MKPIPAIVENQHETTLAAVRATYSALREAETQAVKLSKRLEAATGAADMRRLELGKALVAARELWPPAKAAQGGARGPGGKTWAAYLEGEGIALSSAWRYMELAGYVEGSFQIGDLKGPGRVPTYAEAGIGREGRPANAPDAPDFDPVPQPPAALPRPGFALRLGDWRSVLIDAGMVDALITDHPYGARTHENSRRNGNPREDGYALDGLGPEYTHWSSADVMHFAQAWSPRVRGWMVALCSHDLIPAWEAAYEAVDRYGFAPVPCVINGMSVRLGGDGPSSWTVYAMVGRPRTGAFSRWGTLPGAYTGGREPGAEGGRGKPSWLMRAIVRDYSRPGDLICDPLAGYGATLIAAIDEGRRAIGAELDHAAYDEAHRRAARPRATDDSTARQPEAEPRVATG